MNPYHRKSIGLAGAVCLLAGTAHAHMITPVSVTASSTFSSYDVNNLINDSGLSAGVHDTSYHDMWLNDVDQEVTHGVAVLTFDLGGFYNLSAVDIWQFNDSNLGLSRGVQSLQILTSLDGISYQLSGSATLSKGSGAPEAARVEYFNASAQFVQLSILSNFGAAYTGLSEVKFEGIDPPPPPTSAAVPEPASLSLIFAGLLGFTGSRRKQSGRRAPV